MITTTPASPSLASDRQSEGGAKGTRHRRKGVTQDTAHELHRLHRRRWYRQIQHAVLDILIRDGSFHVADLDDLDLPEGISRSVMGTAIRDLALSHLIRRAGPPAPTTANGRHANILYTWQLAAVRDAVEALEAVASGPAGTGQRFTPVTRDACRNTPEPAGIDFDSRQKSRKVQTWQANHRTSVRD